VVLGWKGQVQMKVGESTGTGSGGARAVAATASDRCTGSGGRQDGGVGGGG